MKKERTASQSDIICRSIEDDIISGALFPGAALDEETLTRRFGVSRTPVREAFLKLEEVGLVERLPRKGCVVARTDLQKLIMTFELMSELEGICVRLATRRMSAGEKSALASEHRLSEKALAEGRTEDFYQHSLRFHMLLIQGTHNPEIAAVANRAGMRLIPYRRHYLGYPGQCDANLKDHAEILQAVLAGDAEQASILMKKHTSLQGDAMVEYSLILAKQESA